MTGKPQDAPGPGVAAAADPSSDLTWLAFRAADALAAAFNQAARDAGLADLRDWLVLALIGDGTERTQLEIATHLGIDKSTLVPLLDRLEKAVRTSATGAFGSPAPPTQAGRSQRQSRSPATTPSTSASRRSPRPTAPPSTPRCSASSSPTRHPDRQHGRPGTARGQARVAARCGWTV